MQESQEAYTKRLKILLDDGDKAYEAELSRQANIKTEEEKKKDLKPAEG